MKIEIEVPEGYEAVKTDNGYKFVKADQEKKWEDFGKIEGFYLDESGDIDDYDCCSAEDSNRNTYPTKEEANAYGIALPQLLQWKNKVNGDWKADWSSPNQAKHCLYQIGLSFEITVYNSIYEPLAFPTRKIAEQFLKDHKTLINELIL